MKETIYEKPVVWFHGEVKSPPFSPKARLETGILLGRLQQGESFGLPHLRPMPSIGRRCHELRIVDRDQTWRIVLRIDEDAIIVLEVFSKKTRQTPKHVINACQIRIKAYEESAEE